MRHTATSTTLMLFSLGALVPMVIGCSSGDSISDQIGVVDQKQVLENYDRRKEEYGKLQNHVAQLQKDLDSKSEEIERQQEAYDKNRTTMSVGQRTTREDEIHSLYEEYKIQRKDFQETVDHQKKLILDSIKEDIDDACTHFLAVHMLKHIVNTEDQTDFEKWKSLGAVDLTAPMIEYLNSR
jgi:Skp family chaperone for outer membrane proteins